MLWTVRLGAVLVAAAFASALFAERGLLHDPLFFLMLAGYAGVVGLWWGRALSYRARAAGFCASVFAAGAAGLFSLGVLPGPVVVCAFVVIAARLFVGAGAMLGWLGVTTLVIVLAAHDGRGTVWPGARELGAWFLPRMAMGFALATASVAVIVAHVVDKLEASLRATSDALARLSATEAERERARAELAKTEAALLRSQKLEAMGRLAQEPDFGKKLGEAGRKRVEEEFSFEQMARRYEALYVRLLEAAPAGSAS